MPPKSKRKAVEPDNEDQNPASDVDGDGGDNAKPAKKAKRTSAPKPPVVPLDPSLPTNITFPIDVKFPAKAAGTTRLSCWNVCGIAACVRKGFDFYVKAEDADVLILTETKVDKEYENDTIKTKYPYRIWGADPKKGTSGTAVLSKIKPLKTCIGLPTFDEKQTAGRCITVEFDKYVLIATYVPNSGEKLKNMDYKKQWNSAFEKYLRELDNGPKPVIWGGDFNCAPTDKDIRHAKPNWNKTPGYTQDETDGYISQLNPGSDSGHRPLIDIWRLQNPDTIGHYTYYSFRFKCREKGIGWRLDSWILSERITKKAKSCEIRHECYGASDHVPVVLDLEGDL